jgi:tRNA dimethylallyltransferase
MKKFLIVVLGPTGIGKTDVAIELARYFNTEIISADSRQFYIEMKTGTAVPTDKQLKEVKHHFVRFLSVKDYYSASLFERDVLNLLYSLFLSYDYVIMSGGSGIPDIEPKVRDKYNRIYREEGIESLRIALKIQDPGYYNTVDLRNHKRIIRALEICESAGRPYSAFLTGNRTTRNFNIIRIGLEIERKELYERINNRVDRMIEEGLEEEARGLFELRALNALKSVGYSEFFNFFEGRITREKAIELIKRNSRRYAKRQITWWSKEKDIKWFHPGNIREMIDFITESDHNHRDPVAPVSGQLN